MDEMCPGAIGDLFSGAQCRFVHRSPPLKVSYVRVLLVLYPTQESRCERLNGAGSVLTALDSPR